MAWSWYLLEYQSAAAGAWDLVEAWQASRDMPSGHDVGKTEPMRMLVMVGGGQASLI